MRKPHVRFIMILNSIRVLLASSLFFSAIPFMAIGESQAQEQAGIADATLYLAVGYEKDGVFIKLSEASGFLVSQNGWIVTAKHLTEVPVPGSLPRLYRASVKSRTDTAYEVFEVPGPLVSSDVTLLRFSPALDRTWPYLKIFAGGDPVLSQPIAAYGFPLGQEFTVRPGEITSLIGPKGTLQINAGLAPGMSGGPVVLKNTPCVVGIVAGGSGYPSFDFFTSVKAARPLLDQASATFVTGKEPQSNELVFERSFPVDQTKDDHGASESSEGYELRFDAEEDAEIVSARFDSTSETRSSDRNITISGDRNSAVLRFRLTSGPIFNQYRGWLHGSLILTQRRASALKAEMTQNCP